MLIIEIPKNNTALIKEVESAFDNCIVAEVNSLGADTVVQILVPAITIGVPALSAIIVQIIKNDQTTIKYDNIELKGSSKTIIKMIEQFDKQKNNDKQRHMTKKR